METILIVFVTGALCIGCFFVGAKVGQSVAKGEPIKAPSLNPIKAIREHQEREEAEMEQKRIDTIMRNVERYDGTSRGQEDVG
jgi:hypothetical protein